jgi:hypothetical protein
MAIAGQWLSKHIPAAMNTHATVEELLDAAVVCHSTYSMCSERKVGDCFFPDIYVSV